jgi:uncharacterized protein (TIGR02145 family)
MKQLILFLFLNLLGSALIASDCAECDALERVAMGVEPLAIKNVIYSEKIVTLNSSHVPKSTWAYDGLQNANEVPSFSAGISENSLDGQLLSTTGNIQDSTVLWSSVYSEQCRAKVSSTEAKVFMCHNLGASNQEASHLNPSWEISGGYWQWGRNKVAAAGPTGPAKINAAAVAGWQPSYAKSHDWTDSLKTANDPCPQGFRIPNKVEWESVLANNKITYVGTWVESTSNYTSGIKIGDSLFLPASGARNSEDGILFGANNVGFYWSTTEEGNFMSWVLEFSNGNAAVNLNAKIYGFSVRCIEQ